MSYSEQQTVRKNNIPKVLLALLLGLLTAYFCLYLADGVFGI